MRNFMKANVPTKELILSRIRINKETNCWEWQGARNPKGYGRLTLWYKMWYSHRLAYTIWKGPIPEKRFVCHHCDTPPCCNPDHLFLATHRENFIDAANKGRVGKLLSPKQVREIKLTLRDRKELNLLSVALKCNIPKHTVTAISANQIYKDIKI